MGIAGLIMLCVGGDVRGDESLPVERAERLFSQVEKRFDDVKSLSYTVERVVRMHQAEQKDSWTFRIKQPAGLCVEYSTPHKRRIVTDGTVLWEYIPEIGKAMRTDLTVLNEERRRDVIASVLGRVTVDGIRLGNYQELLKQVVSVSESAEDENVMVVEGASPKFFIHIDVSRNVIVQTEVYDGEGRLRIRTRSSGFVEAAPSFWFPQEIGSAQGTEKGMVQGIVRISNIRVDEEKDESFQFIPSPDIAIVENQQ